MDEPMVRVEGLKKYFSTARGLLHAVDDVTMSIQKGHTVGIVGESGCGKSTLGRTIIHLLDKIFQMLKEENLKKLERKCKSFSRIHIHQLTRKNPSGKQFESH